MPRSQSQHHHSQPTLPHHPASVATITPLRSKTKLTMKPTHLPQTPSTTPASSTTSTTTPATTVSTKKVSTTPRRLTSSKTHPPSHQKSIKPKKKNAPKSLLTSSNPKNNGSLSLLSLYDLSAELYSLSSRSNPKLTSSTRKPKKNLSNHVLVLPQSSDSEDVHSIFLPHTNYSSRSSTPTPTKLTQLTLHNLDEPSIAPPLDDLHLPSHTAEQKPTPSSALHSNSTPVPSSNRRHVRAKSVASIFQTDQPLPLKAPVTVAKDDWDMPFVHPTRDPTWQQKEKKVSPLSHPSIPASCPTQNLSQHDSLLSLTRPTVSQSSKGAHPVRPPKSRLSRTSSAGTISRLITSQPSNFMSPSRSDDESALTWQQTIIRPLPKSKSLPPSHMHQASSPSENKPGGHKKSHGNPACLKTPTKSLPSARRAGVSSVAKPKSGSLQSTFKRRNSLSSGTTFHSLDQSDVTPIPTQSIASSGGPGTISSALSWKSFPTSTVGNHRPDLPSLRSTPFPTAGAQTDQTPIRRHTKSYTHQPTSLPDRRPIQLAHTSGVTSGYGFSNMVELTPSKAPSTPIKSRSTSEDLNLTSPEKQFATPALRAAFMYAGPQFHNSPCPAALPAPKFSFASA